MISNCNINQEWQNSKLPIINGIVYKNGNIDLININYENEKRKVEHGSKLHINDLLSTSKLQLAEVAVLNRIEDINNDIVIYCGDGGLGGDGFVLVESKTNSKIKWLAFFENSNPFDEIEIVGSYIYAYNNLGEKWGFNINTPSDLSIEYVNP